MYQSKRNPEITANLETRDEKFKTVLLEYVSGPEAGKTVSITESTFKRWWKKIDDENVVSQVVVEKKAEDVLNLDYDKINEPYPEPTTQKYVKKPKSVVDYEEKKHKTYNKDLPTQEEMVEQFGSSLSKVNKTYIVFNNGCWLERKNGYTNLYANESVWETLTQLGLQARPNGMKNTKLNFVFKITTMEEYNKVAEVLING